MKDSSGDRNGGPSTRVFTKKAERARRELRESGRKILVIRRRVEKKD